MGWRENLIAQNTKTRIIVANIPMLFFIPTMLSYRLQAHKLFNAPNVIGQFEAWYGYGMARRILPLASILLGAGVEIYGLVGLYNPQFRIAHRWSGFEVSLGGALMIWGWLFFRRRKSN